MVTSVTTRGALFLDGCSDAAQDLRLQGVAASLTATGAAGTTGIAATAGVRQGVGTPLKCTWTSLLSFTVAAGTCFVQGSTSATAGIYTVTLDTTATLTCTTADATNPRIDSVAVVVTDNGNGTSTAAVAIYPGTPAPSPSAPTLPANSLLLCNITVPANATALSAGAFADKRLFTVASGAILPYPNTAGATIAGPKGSYVYDQTTDRLKALDGSGNARQPKIGAFAGVVSSSLTDVPTSLSTYTTILTTTVTTDGVTEVEIFASWNAMVPATGTVDGDWCNVILVIDGFGVSGTSACLIRAGGTSLQPYNGGSIREWTTPSAGTHTITMQAASAGHVFSVRNPKLRVQPSQAQ